MVSKLHLDSIHHYTSSVASHLSVSLKEKLGDELHMDAVKSNEKELNAYEHLAHLQPIDESHVFHLGEDEDTSLAIDAILAGKVFWEHTAAGEATRLGLGTKYLLNLREYSHAQIAAQMRKERYAECENNEERMKVDAQISEASLREDFGDHTSLLDLSLGERHMYQLAFDISSLAQQQGYDASEVLRKQSMLIVVNEQTQDKIIENFIEHNFFGFDSSHVYFMVQKAFHGMHLVDGKLCYDDSTSSNKRLHNHGQLVMQKTHDGELFTVDVNTQDRLYITSKEYEELLSSHDDFISFNIEDLEYLTNALDLPSISLALRLREKGYNMVMEIVAQNPIKPQKGGACFYDPIKKKNVMIESFQLGNVRNEDITHLNKNFNHYVDPVVAFRAVKEQGLPISFSVKNMPSVSGALKDYIYPCPVQGDVNFLVDTAFVMRSKLKPISNWKSPATTPATIKAMQAQDAQEGFVEFVKK